MGAFENAIHEEETFESLLELYRKSLQKNRELEEQLASRGKKESHIEWLRSVVKALEEKIK